MSARIEAPTQLSRRADVDARVIQDTVGRLGIHPLLARLALARGLDPDFIWPAAEVLPAINALPDLGPGVARIVKAIAQGEVIAGVFDHDADGCTSGAVLYHAMIDHFQVDPSRLHVVTSHKLKEGYGLSAAVAKRILALSPRPTLVITADQGSSDQAQIHVLREAGIETVVTDHHHVPSDGPPASAIATINPCRADSVFQDKAIAGVGVMWLVMSAVRSALATTGTITTLPPHLRHLLDFVAVGTVADAVSLASPMNRWFVQRGLGLIRKQMRPCWAALNLIGEAELRGGVTARDIAFEIGPRINAQGRMDDACEGIRYLTAPTAAMAAKQLRLLEQNNALRKEVERGLVDEALGLASGEVKAGRAGLTLFLENGSPSVHGIVASRIVDRFQRPTICLSPAPNVEGQLTGSVRTVGGFDVRKALERIDVAQPGLMAGFGGHTAAGGLRIKSANWVKLAAAWDEEVRRARLPAIRTMEVDEDLEHPPSLDLLRQLVALEPMGRGFEPAVFTATVEVLRVQVFKEQHVCLTVRWPGHPGVFKALWFSKAAQFKQLAPVFDADRPNLHATLAFELSGSTYRGATTLDLMIAQVIAVRCLGEQEIGHSLAMAPPNSAGWPVMA